MGLLDDAIREHLELKRRRGADAEEVTRQENEALGPPQRAEFAEAPAAESAEPAAEAPPADEPPPVAEAEEPPVEEPRDEGWLERALPGARAAAGGADRAQPADGRVRRRPAARPGRAADARAARRGRGRAGGDARLPPGDAGARPAVVRAEAAARLRPRPIAARPYTLLDVFTDRPLAGNGLAVVHDADGLSDDAMLAFARETRLSETSFVQRADGAADYRHRIFTMGGEIPFAGHPSLGTAVAVARARGETSVHLRPADAAGRPGDRRRARRAARERLDAPGAAAVRARARSRRRARASSGLDGAEADPALPCQVVSTGVAAGDRLRRATPPRCAACSPPTTASGAC